MKKAFTLLEILIVVSVLVVLIAIIVPRITGFQQQAKISKAKKELQTIQVALESYAIHHGGTYPTQTDTITDVLKGESPQMLDRVLYDPFGGGTAEYQYSVSADGKSYALSSDGPDRVNGTAEVLNVGSVPTSGDDLLTTNGTSIALDVQTDENNCGTIGTDCAEGETCTAGVCVDPDPCAAANSPAAGTVCADGTVYVNSALRTTPGDMGLYGWLNCAPYGGSVGNGCYDAGYNLLAPNISTWARNAASGEANIVILKTFDADLSDYPAAQACENSTANGQDDWYWPAMNELSVLYVNRVAIGGFTVSGAKNYWSSTEGANMVANVIPFDAGTISWGNKADISRVRCVRTP